MKITTNNYSQRYTFSDKHPYKCTPATNTQKPITISFSGDFISLNKFAIKYFDKKGIELFTQMLKKCNINNLIVKEKDLPVIFEQGKFKFQMIAKNKNGKLFSGTIGEFLPNNKFYIESYNKSALNKTIEIDNSGNFTIDEYKPVNINKKIINCKVKHSIGVMNKWQAVEFYEPIYKPGNEVRFGFFSKPYEKFITINNKFKSFENNLFKITLDDNNILNYTDKTFGSGNYTYIENNNNIILEKTEVNRAGFCPKSKYTVQDGKESFEYYPFTNIDTNNNTLAKLKLVTDEEGNLNLISTIDQKVKIKINTETGEPIFKDLETNCPIPEDTIYKLNAIYQNAKSDFEKIITQIQHSYKYAQSVIKKHIPETTIQNL